MGELARQIVEVFLPGERLRLWPPLLRYALCGLASLAVSPDDGKVQVTVSSAQARASSDVTARYQSTSRLARRRHEVELASCLPPIADSNPVAHFGAITLSPLPKNGVVARHLQPRARFYIEASLGRLLNAHGEDLVWDTGSAHRISNFDKLTRKEIALLVHPPTGRASAPAVECGLDPIASRGSHPSALPWSRQGQPARQSPCSQRSSCPRYRTGLPPRSG
jgi:hypothetical protein